MVPVRVPAAAGQAVLVPEDADDAAAGLDQPAGGQARLAEQRLAVQVAGGVGLAAQIEGLGQLGRFEQGQCRLLVLGQRSASG